MLVECFYGVKLHRIFDAKGLDVCSERFWSVRRFDWEESVGVDVRSAGGLLEGHSLLLRDVVRSKFALIVSIARI